MSELIGRSTVTVSRLWGNPEIFVWVDALSLGMRISLDDFIVALAKEMGNPTLMITQAQLLARMQTAARVVEATVKESSVVL